MKKIYFILFVLLLLPLNVCAYTNYFDYKNKLNELVTFDGNRTSAEQIVKSVAELYLYKNYSTDYEQKNMDIYSYDHSGNLTTSSDSYLNKTFAFRNFNMTPFDLSRSNHNNFDCSSFVTNVYLNSFGFDFRDYYSDNYKAFVKSYVSPDFSNGSLLNSAIHFNSYTFDQNSLLYSGRGPSTVGLKNLQTILDSKGNESNNSKLFTYAYENTSGISKAEFDSLDFEAKLKTGDIFLVRRVDNEGNKSGHVMIYVKDHISNSDTVSNGFIHSTGSDFPLSTFDKGTSSFGIDKFSVRYITYANYINNNFPTTGVVNSKGKKITYVAIIRPINVILNGTYTNAYTNTKVKKTTSNIYTLGTNSYSVNNGVVTDNYKISMQQYLYNNTQKSYINSTNVINDGDEVAVKAYVKNKGKKTRTVTIKMDYLDTNKLVYVTYGCKSNRTSGSSMVEYSKCSQDDNIIVSKSNGVVTFRIKNLKPGENANVYYKFKYTNSTNQETITVPGMALYFGDGTDTSPIQFRNLTITGSKNKFTTYSGNMSENVIHKVNSYYFNNGSAVNRDKSLLRMYNQVFGINISALGNLDSKTSTTVKNVVHGLFEYKTSNEQGNDTLNGWYYNPSDSAIAKMVVKGMYGGSIVRASTDYERTHLLTFEMLEPGDIVVVYNGSNNKKFGSYMFVYGGYKTVVKNNVSEKQYILYYRQRNVYVTTKKSMNILKRALASELFVVLRPTQNSSAHFATNLASSNNSNVVVSRLYYPFTNESEDYDDNEFTADENLEIILAEDSVIENPTLNVEGDLEEDSDDTEIEIADITYEEDEDFREIYAINDNTSVNKNIIILIIGIVTIMIGIYVLYTYSSIIKDNK